MKEGLRSASKRSGTLEKDKVVPSKKGSSGKQKVFESKKEKKRPQLEISDSESDKELPIARRGKIGRGTNRDSNGSVVKRNNEDSFERKAEIETDRKRIRSEKPVKYRNDFEEAQKEKKSRMEVFEYNEDDIVDIKKVIKAPSNAVGTEIVGSKVLGSKPRNVAVDKRKHSNFERNGGPDNSDKKRFKLKNDGAFRPVRSVREKSGVPVKKPIRVQGKNGVLKAKKMVAGVSKLTDKKQVNSRKISSTRGRKASRKRIEDSDTSMQMGPENLGSCSSKKETKNKGEAALTSEIHVAERQNEGKMGRSTKKELIRDQIRDLLLKSGWTIDFRPRRGRDYHDAVYISPSGSGYWSILKAYYVFQKQCKDEDSIPAEAIGLLTRKTHKKMEREMKMKEKADKGNNKAKENTMKDGKSLKVHYLEARKNKKQRGRALLGRSSNKEMIQDDDDFIPYNGKRSVLTWLIDSGIVPLNGKVKYMNKRQTRSMLEGLITRDGINCGCCSKIFTISKFEIHAGSKLCQPFQNMFVETGASLLQCQVDAWNKQEESQRRDFHSIAFNRKDPNDDTCGICGDGGDLICCDGCPSTFHISCLGIQVLPPGDWHCLNCSCKFCGVFGGSSGGGDDITTSKLLTCGLCEEKYHGSCIEQINAVPAESNSLCNSFCGLKCREVSEQFQKLLGVKHELEAGYSWTLIKRSVLDSDTSLDGLPQKAECNSKLAVALTVMDECFLPIVDRRSGINLIHNVLYNCGCNFNRLNYSGFFTAILERGDEIISAASIRIHGTRLAEMPFIGTRNIYRRQGMCRRLLNAIESALCSLKVEKLIIPAISELMHTWTVVFGFKPIEESHKQEMRSMNMLVFPGVDLLHKILVNQNSSEGSVTSDSVVKVIEPESSHDITPEETNKPDMGSSIRSAIIASDEIVDHHAHGISNNVAAVETILQDTSDATSNSSDAPYGTISHVRGEEAVCNNFQSQDAFPESELENKSIMDLPVDPNLQSSTEVAVAVGDAHEVNVEIAGNEPNLPVLDEISIPNTSDGVSEHPDTVSGPDLLATDFNALQDDLELNRQDLELNRQDLQDVESKSVDVSHPESDACEVETEVTAVEPDLDIIVKPRGSSENNACYDLENKNQTLITVCESNCKGSDESSMNPNFDAADLRPDTVVKTEVAVTEHKSQAVGEDLVGCVSKVVGKSLYAPECRNDDLLPNTHDLEDESSKTIHGDSSVPASIMANTLDTCKEEVRVVASVDHCQKILQ